jgi:hypothetical protein
MNPVFKNSHNAGQKTTEHRAMEKSRVAANSKPPHPEAGQFSASMDDNPNGAESSPFGPPSTTSMNPSTKYSAPSGASVTVTDNSPDNPDPHSATMNIKGSDGTSHTSSRAAAKKFAQTRNGINP